MATNIHGILRHYATKQNSGHIIYTEFIEYLRRYAQRHLEENPDLSAYLTNTNDILQKEIAKLELEHKAAIISPNTEKKAILVNSFYADRFASKYRDIQNNISIPFPSDQDLPKFVPFDIFEKKTGSEFLVELLKQPLNDEYSMYSIILQQDLPILMLPSSIGIDVLVDLAIGKIRQMLRKEEYHDYFLKKIRIANPGKEIAAKNFFNTVTSKPAETLELLKTSSDSFYFWNQLCYFIKQDYEKVKDYTQEDLCLLQSVAITEISISFFKNKNQKDLQRQTALRNLEQIMHKPPYYFNKEAIVRFVDSKGIPLLGQYSEQDLNNFLHEATTSMEQNNLPTMLVFKVENGQHYFIYKNKVLPLVIRLCSDARDVARDTLTKEWHELCRQFETVPAMKDQKAFNDRLEQIVKQSSPVLYSILTSNFLSLVHYEARTNHDASVSQLNIFSNGKLQPYSDLLMLSRQEILTDAKILLPFWYTTPIISWFARLFLKKPSSMTKQKKSKVQEETVVTLKSDDEEIPTKTKESTKKDDFIAAAKKVEAMLVPEDSTLDRELASYIHQWNPLLNKQSRANLTEDVNSLIRDYLRRVLRNSKASSFTPERIEDLAQTLCRTPNMQKIKEQEQLVMYVQLYMVKLVKDL